MKPESAIKDISAARLSSQSISRGDLRTPEGVVAWLVAIQAQDFDMARWAVGVRLPGSTDTAVQNAVGKSRIIRTHVLRPTWHFVTAQDVGWLLDLTAPQIRTALRSRHRQLELSDSIIRRSHKLLEKLLGNGAQLTRGELTAAYRSAKIATDDNRLSHFLLLAELDKLICSGGVKRGKPTYAIYGRMVPGSKPVPREEALATLARRYFDSRGPATIADFIWWSGLPSRDAARSVEMIRSHVDVARIGEASYLCSRSTTTNHLPKDSLYLLPAYDEFLLSYADRSAALSRTRQKKTISSNGIFRPTIVLNGKVVGIWKRTRTGPLEAAFFEPPGRKVKDKLREVAQPLGSFYGTQITIQYE